MNTGYALAAPGLAAGVIRDADGAFIPAAAGNTDWQAYLAWVAAGNTASPYVPPVLPPPTVISAEAFLMRFTQAEQLAVQQAAITDPIIALGLTMGLARGTIDLNGPLLGPWMQELVTAGCITETRAAVIMTP